MSKDLQDIKDDLKSSAEQGDILNKAALLEIEELEAKLSESEALLAKAVDALYVIERWSDRPGIVVSKVRTTLAELTGGNDE